MARKYTNEEVASIVNNEGLDYTLQSYLDPKDIKDPALRDLCIQARTLLDKIDKFLEPYCNGREEDE